MLSMSCYACIDRLEAWLDSYLNFEKTPKKNIFWLDTMEYLCTRLSNPQKAAPCFHIAGSKGKGSVSAFISSILEAAGYRTGLYTSPHILDFVERIGSAHGPFPEAVYQAAARELTSTIETLSTADLPGGRPLTWFELVTLYAFLCFRQAQVDYSVYEVGLGGRLDSTNVVSPLAACITPIELEHTEFLGDSLEKIAAEKAGIIKEGGHVFVADQKESVRQVFRRIAAEKKASLTFIDSESCSIESSYLLDASGDFRMKACIASSLFSRPITAFLQLPGSFQAKNAALAAIAVKSRLPDIPEEALEEGLSQARLPGRFQIYRQDEGTCPGSGDSSSGDSSSGDSSRSGQGMAAPVILDGAHTVNSVGFTLETLESYCQLKKHTAPLHLLFACAADKDMTDIARLFSQAKRPFSAITLTRPGAVKQSNLPALCQAFSKAGLSYTCDEDYEQAIRQALQGARLTGSLLLVTGSFYLVAEVRKILGEHAL